MKRLRGNQQGQMTMEMILISIILTTVTLMIISTARNEQWAASMLEGPWTVVQGMIENGVWRSGDSKTLHPHMFGRKLSVRGDTTTGP